MTRFSKLELGPDGQLKETNVRIIAQSDLLGCPHSILMAEHYREDGSCRCNDPGATVMAEWGYTWSPEKGAWE